MQFLFTGFQFLIAEVDNLALIAAERMLELQLVEPVTGVECGRCFLADGKSFLAPDLREFQIIQSKGGRVV